MPGQLSLDRFDCSTWNNVARALACALTTGIRVIRESAVGASGHSVRDVPRGTLRSSQLLPLRRNAKFLGPDRRPRVERSTWSNRGSGLKLRFDDGARRIRTGANRSLQNLRKFRNLQHDSCHRRALAVLHDVPRGTKDLWQVLSRNGSSTPLTIKRPQCRLSTLPKARNSVRCSTWNNLPTLSRDPTLQPRRVFHVKRSY